MDHNKPLSNNTKNGMSIQMFASPAAAYSVGEGYCDRNPQCEECLYGGALCSVCYYCNIDFGDVEVNPDYCRKCNGPYNNCYCCWICEQYPCQCYPDYGCSYCGSYYCSGSCQTSCYYCGSRSCSGSCQSTGGGGGGTINPPTEGSETKIPEDLSDDHGTANYYPKRHDDAEGRLGSDKSPDYYKKYGEKYYEEFNKLKDKLSEKGKKWVDDTALLLQEGITNLLKENPNIEKNGDTFRAAAFETHAEAYIQGGILDLSLREKMQIFFTVEPEDLFKPEGLSQVWDVGKAQVQRWNQNPAEAISEAADFVNSYEFIREQVKTLVSLPPHILSKSATAEYTNEEIDNMILTIYKEQIEYFQNNVPGFTLSNN